MNFEFANAINPHLEKLDFPTAIANAESELKKLSVTEFHHVIGKSLAYQARDLALWIEDFFQKASNKLKVRTLYFEMNEFDINTDYWYIDGFAYNNDKGLNSHDMNWISDFEADTASETQTIFIIEGFEMLQAAFASNNDGSKTFKDSKDWCEQLIIARFMELMRTAHLTATKESLSWSKLPIYFTEHEYSFIVKSEIRNL